MSDAALLDRPTDQPAALGGDASPAAPELDLAAPARRAKRGRALHVGMVVLFADKGRTFRGADVTPAIVTRIISEADVNLMILPNGGVPYCELDVAHESAARGRKAWRRLEATETV